MNNPTKNLKRVVGVAFFVAACFTPGAYAGTGSADALGNPDTNLRNIELFDQQCTGVCVPDNITTFASGFGAATSVFRAGMTSAFAANTGNWTGTLYSTVLTNDAHNPYGTSGLDFVYQVANDPTSSLTDPITRLSVSGFDTGFLTSVGYVRIPQGGPFTGTEVYPSFLGSAPPPGAAGAQGPKPAESVDRTTNGNTVDWNFLAVPVGAGELTAGLRSPFLIVYTDARNARVRTEAVADDGIAAPLGWSPTPAIPEPETYAMMLAGLGLMGFVVRRRRGAKTAA